MLNKTPKKLLDETESAPKNSKFLLKLVLVFIAVFILARVLLSVYYQSANSTTLQTPNGNINLEIVDTPELRQLGLSGRSSISDADGMLFVFENSSTNNCFWMKDMLFSIDMVWLDENKSVINVTPDIAPDSYPESFCPTGPARYGLELSQGNANRLDIVDGSELRW